MRPTVIEQLDQSVRLLETFVLPGISEARPRDILDGVVANLRMLSSGLPELPGFLAWDNDAMLSLLAQLGIEYGAAEESLHSVAAGEVWLSDAELLNERLRQLLTETILSLPADDAKLLPILAHLSERAARSPMRAIPPTPRASKSDKAEHKS